MVKIKKLRSEKKSMTCFHKQKTGQADVKDGKAFSNTIKLLNLIVVGFVTYTYLAFMACYVIPITLAFIGGTTGITYESQFADMFVMWVMPSFFIVGVLLVFSIVFIRGFHRRMAKVSERVIDAYMAKKVSHGILKTAVDVCGKAKIGPV